MCEVILSAIISFFVDAIGNFFFSKFLNNNIDEQKALNSKIININKTNNRLDHNQINQNTMDNNIIGNNNSIFNYNQNIQVTNNMNMIFGNFISYYDFNSIRYFCSSKIFADGKNIK